MTERGLAVPVESRTIARMSRARSLLAVGALLLAALALRLSTWSRTFGGGRVTIDGPDGYYHLRRGWLAMQSWPRVPQIDLWLNFPAGGRISWPPLFDALLALLALPFRSRAAIEIIGALLPALLGLAILATLYALVTQMGGRMAGFFALAIGAVLPGIVRYTLIGALDHDPWFELGNVTALLAAAAESWPRRRRVIVLAIALSAQILGWTGAIVGVGIVTVFALLQSEEASRVLAIAALIAAAIVTPFAATSTWSVATFEGLSWLHVAVLFGAAFAASLRARFKVPAIVSGIAFAILFVPSVGPFMGGLRYASGDAPILAMVGEAQPLLRLFGVFDLRPLLFRLGFLPLALLLVRRRHLPTTAWAAITLTLALLHSRFSFDAAIALAALAGLVLAERKLVLAACGLVLAVLPGIAAYVPLPGLAGYNFYTRPDVIRDYDLDRIAGELRARPAGAVLAPWFFGHFILWRAEKPVVLSPMLSVGQSEFAEGMRWFFIEDEAAAKRALDRWHVHYVFVTPEVHSIATRAAVAGIDARRYDNPNFYLHTIAARLTYFARPPAGYREIARSRSWIQGPFGLVPNLRVYEVVP
ncbi:MAG TPA: hypothetical protein VHX14_03665 [Thermoanaerobaculia bacterium]|jgi:dolichyl-diphosphooligosaccharide--protein glycosyltransferase|nr:hypothetical protein [Thermoanaerobaculia bacterium]